MRSDNVDAFPKSNSNTNHNHIDIRVDDNNKINEIVNDDEKEKDIVEESDILVDNDSTSKEEV